MTVFIYGLYDPRTQELRYIGKTIDLSLRLALHVCEKKNTHKNQWLKTLTVEGMKPEMRILETIENSNDMDWQDRERWWIESSRNSGHPITNLDSGGRGGQIKCESTRQKMSIAAMGRRQTPEAIAKMRETKRKNMTPELREIYRQINVGRKHSEESRMARSVAMKGRIVSDETKRKIGEAHRGRTLSEETKVKIRAARARQVITEEHKAKLSAAFKGRKPSPQTIAASVARCKGVPLTPEFRAKLSEAAKRRSARAKKQNVDIAA